MTATTIIWSLPSIMMPLPLVTAELGNDCNHNHMASQMPCAFVTVQIVYLSKFSCSEEELAILPNINTVNNLSVQIRSKTINLISKMRNKLPESERKRSVLSVDEEEENKYNNSIHLPNVTNMVAKINESNVIYSKDDDNVSRQKTSNESMKLVFKVKRNMFKKKRKRSKDLVLKLKIVRKETKKAKINESNVIYSKDDDNVSRQKTTNESMKSKYLVLKLKIVRKEKEKDELINSLNVDITETKKKSPRIKILKRNINVNKKKSNAHMHSFKKIKQFKGFTQKNLLFFLHEVPIYDSCNQRSTFWLTCGVVKFLLDGCDGAKIGRHDSHF